MVLIMLSILLFLRGPQYHSPRSLKAFWNLGHILYFFLLPYAILPYLIKRHLTLPFQLLIIFGFTLALGSVIELVQSCFMRTPDVEDVFRDIIGALCYLAFLSPARKEIFKRFPYLLKTIALGLILLQIAPVVIALADEFRARARFPVLSDFESPSEIQRWEGNAHYSIDTEFAHSGQHALKVSFKNTQFSGVSLHYFPENWECYNSFQFYAYNSSPEMVPIVCRIHDEIHSRSDQHFNDRFNHTFHLTRGWNRIEIALKTVRNAPVNRQMDMRHIWGVGIFVWQLHKSYAIYLDDFKLQ